MRQVSYVIPTCLLTQLPRQSSTTLSSALRRVLSMGWDGLGVQLLMVQWLLTG